MSDPTKTPKCRECGCAAPKFATWDYKCDECRRTEAIPITDESIEKRCREELINLGLPLQANHAEWTAYVKRVRNTALGYDVADAEQAIAKAREDERELSLQVCSDHSQMIFDWTALRLIAIELLNPMPGAKFVKIEAWLKSHPTPGTARQLCEELAIEENTNGE